MGIWEKSENINSLRPILFELSKKIKQKKNSKNQNKRKTFLE